MKSRKTLKRSLLRPAYIYCPLIIKILKFPVIAPIMQYPANILPAFAIAWPGNWTRIRFCYLKCAAWHPKSCLQELALSPLGKVLSDAKSGATVELMPVGEFYTRPVLTELPQEISLKGFWQGQHALPKSIEPAQPATIPAMVIKKGGDFPAFWQKQNSFVESWRIFISGCARIL